MNGGLERSAAAHMELFRLGRLEYQPRTLQQDIVFGEVSLAAGTPILIHIPAGRTFCQRELSASLCSAGPFFERYFQRSFSGSTVIPGCSLTLYEICFPLHREPFNSSVFLPFTVKIFHFRRQSNAFSGVYRQTHSIIPGTPACSGRQKISPRRQPCGNGDGRRQSRYPLKPSEKRWELVHYTVSSLAMFFYYTRAFPAKQKRFNAVSKKQRCPLI